MEQPARLKHIGDAAGFLQAVAGFAVAGLVMLGAGGTLYRLLVPGGPLAGIFSRSVAGGIAVLLALLMIGVSFWIARGWISPRVRDRSSELLAYVLAGVGLMYAVEMLAKGA